jgi:hypothetical protein
MIDYLDLMLKESSIFEKYRPQAELDLLVALQLADDKITQRIANLGDGTEWTRKKLNEIKALINEEIGNAYGGLFKSLQEESVNVATVIMGATLGNIGSSLPINAIEDLINSNREIRMGEQSVYTFKELFKLTQDNHARQLRIILASGVSQGLIADRIIKEYKMKSENLSHGQLRTNIFTTINLIRDEGRYQAFKELERSGTTKGYIYDARMDNRTTVYCRVHDQKVYNKPIEEIRHLIKVHANCLLPDSQVESESQIKLITRRSYKGDIYIIKTSEGDTISCTPNHPIFTNDGFICAKEINNKHKVGTNRSNTRLSSNVNNNQGISTIENLFSSFSERGQVISVKVPPTSENFHGDIGVDENVDIVFTDSFLNNGAISPRYYKFINNSFIGRDSYIFRFFNRIGFSYERFMRNFHSDSSSISRLDLVKSLTTSHKRPLDSILFRLCSYSNLLSFKLSNKFSDWDIKPFRDSSDANPVNVETNSTFKSDSPISPSVKLEGNPTTISDDLLNYSSGKSNLYCDILKGKFGDEVQFDDVVSIEIINNVSTHVYNLENDLNYYTTNSIINHNCRSVFRPKPILNQSETRPDQFGVTESQTYEEWYMKQTKEFQKSSLENKRYNAFLEGKYKVKNINDINKSVSLENIANLLS